MAKNKSKKKDNAKNEKGANDAVDDSPYAGIKRRLNHFRFAAVLGILISVGLFGASVFVVVYSGIKSMSAFEDLPKYRVNSLALDYRGAVKTFDQSMAATQRLLDAESTQRTLEKARSLTSHSLSTEQAFEQLLANYGDAMAMAAEQVGGALEWNRYFQADIQALRESSQKRQAKFQAIFAEFPEPDLPEEPVSTPTTKKSP